MTAIYIVTNKRQKHSVAISTTLRQHKTTMTY